MCLDTCLSKNVFPETIQHLLNAIHHFFNANTTAHRKSAGLVHVGLMQRLWGGATVLQRWLGKTEKELGR